MKPQSAKAKGRSFQYWVAEKVAWLFNLKFDNQDDNCPIRSRSMGASGNDVWTVGLDFPYSIECKNIETVSLYKWIEQVKANTKEGQHWLLFHKKNRSKPIVILEADVFFDLLKYVIDHS